MKRFQPCHDDVTMTSSFIQEGIKVEVGPFLMSSAIDMPRLDAIKVMTS